MPVLALRLVALVLLLGHTACSDESTPVAPAEDPGLSVADVQTMVAPGCMRLQGRIVGQPVTGAACTSPIGICRTGMVQGALRGSFTFTATALIPHLDTPARSTVLLTGDRTLTSAGGELFLKDAVALHASSERYGGLWIVVGGTGSFAGANGLFRVHGSGLSNADSARFEGEVCTPGSSDAQ